MKNRGDKGQVWIETVIYMLIAFVMIGMVLAFIKPKIEEIKDKSILEQSVEILTNIEDTVDTIGGPGNKRIVEISLKKGELEIDGVNDLLIFKMDSMHVYSEPGEIVQVGTLLAQTTKKTRDNLVTLTSNYSSSYNLTYHNQEESKALTRAAVPHKLTISNVGYDSKGRVIINFDLG